MATPVTEVVKVNWKQLFPWLALFRTAALALHVRQVLVGIIAAGLIAVGQSLLLDRAFLRPNFFASDAFPANFPENIWIPIIDQLWPIVDMQRDTAKPFTASLPLTIWEFTKLLLTLAWSLVVGGLAGGIMVRRTAFEFAREESLSLRDAAHFVKQRALDYLSAPALPLAAALGTGFVLIVSGWVARWLPGGGYLISAVWGLVYLCGIILAALLMIVVAAWPMMIAAVSVNGGDGFDALSRGFGFVIDRWRYYGWCVLIMTLYGGVCLVLLSTVRQYGEILILSSLMQGSGNTLVDNSILPQLLPPQGWAVCLSLIGSGLAYSYFWSSMTVIYLVLRKSVDNAELQDIFIEGGPHEPDDLQALINPQLNPQLADRPTLLPIIDAPK